MKKPKKDISGYSSAWDTYDKIQNLITKKIKRKNKIRDLIDELSERDLDYIIDYSIMLRQHNQQIKHSLLTRNK